ncbi:BatD family protein [Marinobacter sp. F4206]|uniref:BatD family protein n=1 Tax=Marinobacter sp. F4206 TaxID=2861777 RepID=UPI001C5E6ECA|nr:BatD family protein [Marinobacter sp. F4206]MBW4933670.1 BatD family protein [Marinobacter sp. F4206]
MVKQLTLAAVLLLLLMSLTTSLRAEELKVEPDRTRLYEGEVLTVTVTGSMKLDINLSNLFDFDLSDLPAPDIEKVEPTFEILGKNQRYSIRTENSEMIGEITWTYQLAPKRNGTLTIPTLTFRDSKSRPVTVEVVSGNPPDQGTASRDSFIELSADKAEVYVQEQLTLTIRLFFSGNLIRGELSEPQHPNAIIEPLGKQREFSRYRDGVRYRVVERRYALFPQQPGELSLEPIQFEGQARDASGKLIFLRDSEQLYTVPVKEVPAGFSGNTWLPASGLSLDENGLPPTMQVETGENLTREITLKAAGLPSEALPPLPDATPDGLRSYPEPPERSTEVTPAGLTSTLSQTSALVPVHSGQLTLPEIRIPWWNTNTDSEQVAVIPARTLQVAGSAAPVAQPPETDSTESQPDSPDTLSVSEAKPVNGITAWQWLSLALAILWLVTMMMWWRSKTPDAQHRMGSEESNPRERNLFENLIRSARAGSSSTPALLVQWMNHRFPGRQFQTASDVLDWCDDQTLATEIHRLQAHLFSPEATTTSEWDGRALAEALQRLRRHAPKASSTDSGLPPLYPGDLSA